MLKKILLVLVVIVLAFLVIVALQPSEYRIARSASMAAPPAAVFVQVNDFRKWQAWSPWAKLDPAAKYTFEGPPAGKEAIYRWSGNSEIGEGSMTITESRPNELVRFTLEFKKPMEDTAETEVTLQPEGEGTRVTWTMSGEKGFVAKAVCLFMDLDKTVGGDFEKALASIRAIAEAKP